MTTLATIANMRSEGNLPSSSVIADAKLQPHLESASIEISRLITSDVYAEVLDEASTEQRSIDLTKAEAMLAMAYAIIPLNIETSGSGIVSSRGWDQSRSDVLNQFDAEKLSEHFRQKAMALIGPYLPAVEEGDANDDRVSVGSIAMVAV